VRLTIRNGIDPELYRLAKADAARQGKKIGIWINEAIAQKLGKIAKISPIRNKR